MHPIRRLSIIPMSITFVIRIICSVPGTPSNVLVEDFCISIFSIDILQGTSQLVPRNTSVYRKSMRRPSDQRKSLGEVFEYNEQKTLHF
jgi:hypothetical protein